MLLPLASFAVGIMEPKATAALLITPIANTTIVIREVLTGRATAGAIPAGVRVVVPVRGDHASVWPARMFSSEQLVNPAWEPVSMKSLRRGRRGPGRLPAIDAALRPVLHRAAAAVLRQPNLRQARPARRRRGERTAADPRARQCLRATGRVEMDRDVQPAKSAGGDAARGGLLGMGLPPWISLFQEGLNRVWPPDPESSQMQAEMFMQACRRTSCSR